MTKVSLREAYAKTLIELGEKDKNVVVLDADLSSSTQTAKFKAKFPNRFFNIGIAEITMLNVAAGLATTNKKVFASTFAMFGTGRAWEALRQSICYPNLPVKLVCTHGGITVGEDGATHQACEDLAITRALPNITVIVPCDDIETTQVIKKIYDLNTPVYVRLTREKFPRVFGKDGLLKEIFNIDYDYSFEIGKAYKLLEGKDINIITCGLTTSQALLAAKKLKEEGISSSVIHLPTLKPISKKSLLEVLGPSKLILTVEEHSIIGGLGDAVLDTLSDMDYKIFKHGIKDTFPISGKAWELVSYFKLDAKGIEEKVKDILKKN